MPAEYPDMLEPLKLLSHIYLPIRREELNLKIYQEGYSSVLGFSTKQKWQTSNGQYFLYFIPMNLLLVSIDRKCIKNFKNVQILKIEPWWVLHCLKDRFFGTPCLYIHHVCRLYPVNVKNFLWQLTRRQGYGRLKVYNSFYFKKYVYVYMFKECLKKIRNILSITNKQWSVEN